jgi:hypothetical protein
MPDRKVFDTDSGRHLIVQNAVQNTGPDAQQYDFDGFHDAAGPQIEMGSDSPDGHAWIHGGRQKKL